MELIATEASPIAHRPNLVPSEATRPDAKQAGTLGTLNPKPATTVAAYLHQRGDTQEFCDLSPEPRPGGLSEREEVRLNIEAMLKVDALITQGHKKVEARQIVAREYLGRRGFSLTALNEKHSAWLRGGQRGGRWFPARDWRYLVPQYTNGDVQPMLRNADFCQYLALLVGDATRPDIGNALRVRLLDDWRRGKTIPGVGTIAQYCASRQPPVALPRAGEKLRPAHYPAGWSPSNLARCVKSILGEPDSPDRLYLQRGEHAAMSHWADQLYRSRANLMPLQLITADDVDLDIYVWMPTGDGHVQVVRPKCLFMMDVATGAILRYGIVGAYMRQYYSDGGDADTRRGIQTADMKTLLLGTLEDCGLPVDWPMHFLFENAAAKLNAHDVEMFRKWLPIEFASTQMMQTKLPGGFMESTGNPKQKGWIESWFRLLLTHINHLPGTLGRRYELTRGDVGVALWRGGKQVADRRDTRVGETLAILRQAAQIAQQRGCPITDLLDSGSGFEPLHLEPGTQNPEPGDSPRFRLPVLRIEQLHDLLDHYVAVLNGRTNHNLEGFGQVIDIEIRPGEYIPDYHPAAQQLVRPGMRCHQRMESPMERFQRLTAGHAFRRLTPQEMLVLARDTRPTTITKGQLTVTDQRYSPTPMRYRDAESAAALDRWNSKDKALIYFLSPSGDQAHLFTRDSMEWVASPRRIQAVDILDETAMGRRMGEVARGRDQIRAQAEEIMAPRAAELDALRAHNAALVAADQRPQTNDDGPTTADIAATIQRQEAVATTQRAQDGATARRTRARLAEIARQNRERAESES